MPEGTIHDLTTNNNFNFWFLALATLNFIKRDFLRFYFDEYFEFDERGYFLDTKSNHITGNVESTCGKIRDYLYELFGEQYSKGIEYEKKKSKELGIKIFEKHAWFKYHIKGRKRDITDYVFGREGKKYGLYNTRFLEIWYYESK